MSGRAFSLINNLNTPLSVCSVCSVGVPEREGPVFIQLLQDGPHGIEI